MGSPFLTNPLRDTRFEFQPRVEEESMNRLECIALAVGCFCFICSPCSNASPISYTAVGSVVDNQGMTLPIDGEVYIDNQLRDMLGQPTEMSNLTGVSV